MVICLRKLIPTLLTISQLRVPSLDLTSSISNLSLISITTLRKSTLILTLISHLSMQRWKDSNSSTPISHIFKINNNLTCLACHLIVCLLFSLLFNLQITIMLTLNPPTLILIHRLTNLMTQFRMPDVDLKGDWNHTCLILVDMTPNHLFNQVEDWLRLREWNSTNSATNMKTTSLNTNNNKWYKFKKSNHRWWNQRCNNHLICNF